MDASFEEKSVWIQLASVLLILGVYFGVAWSMMESGVTLLMAYVPLFAICVVLLIAVLIAGHVIAALSGRPEKRDERDRVINWRAECNSSWLLSTGMLAAIAALVFAVDNVWVAHLLLLSLFLSEVLSLVLQLLYYRRGM